MAVRIKFDPIHNAIEPTFVLATRSGEKLGAIIARNIHIQDNFNSFFELSFAVDKYIDGVECALWEQIKDFKLVYCPEWDVWFEINVEMDEDNEILKNISAKSIGESELSQIGLHGIEINTEDDILRDDYKPTILFDETDQSASLLNRIMEKAPHYTIKHVDSTIARIQRTFKFDNKTIYDAFQEISKEIGCLFKIDSGTGYDKPIARDIYVYDLESYCFDCKERGSFSFICSNCGSTNIKQGYGQDTNIFVSTTNLAEGITYTSNTDAVKNCFKLEAGDDLMTATIVNCNPNGSGYIWYLSDEVKSDMSAELRQKLDEYDAQYSYYQSQHATTLTASLVSSYNSLVNKYKIYNSKLTPIGTIKGYPALIAAYYNAIDFQLFLRNELMPVSTLPDTTAAKQAALIAPGYISPVGVRGTITESLARTSVLAMAKVFVDSRYEVKVLSGSLNGTAWTGKFSVTNIADATDTATTRDVTFTITDDYERYLKQLIDKKLRSKSDDATDVVALFDLNESAFRAEVRKYCVASLTSFSDACQACLNVLIEQGVAREENELYTGVYLPYRNKLFILQDEIRTRDNELNIISGVYDRYGNVSQKGIQTEIMDKMYEIQDALNFENFIGRDLWLEFSAYRREDTYKNENYISDGLDNAELIANAREFIAVATKEIYKSAMLQHSITSNMKNLLVMKEFEPLLDKFEVGNWIRIEADEQIYRLRLLSYEINFDDLENIQVVFSDVQRLIDGISDLESILSQASDMSTSYESVKHQAGNGKRTAQILDGWVKDGLALTKMKIIDNAENQNITWDDNGFLCREYSPITDDYDERQLKIINRGLYLTDDNWATSKAGIGNFAFYDPRDGEEKEAYGVIAETLVGNLILSEKVGIYNKNNSITMDEEGLVITTNSGDQRLGKTAFLIRKKTIDENDVESLENVFYVDENGNLHMSGTLDAAEGHFTGEVTATSLTISGESGSKKIDEYIDDVMSQPLQELQDNIDDKTTTWYSEEEPENAVVNDIWYDIKNEKIFRKLVNGTWQDITTAALKLALDRAGTAQSTADGKIRTFAQTEPPNDMTATDVGDLWIDTNDNNKLYRWSGTQWVAYQDSHLNYLIDEIDGKTTTYYDSQQPTSPSSNDIWYDTSKGLIKLYINNSWQDITDNALKKALDAAGDAQATADGKIRTFAQTEPPSVALYDPDVGDLWIDTDDDNKLYRWNGTTWVLVRDGGIAGAISTANDAKTLADQIYNGATGIYFAESTVGTVSINNVDGIKVVGNDNSYFQVKNNAMGFFDSSGSGMMYYENGSMIMKGSVHALSGYIGGTNGWTIMSTYIYNGQVNSFNSAYTRSSGIYIGTDGINLGDWFKVNADGVMTAQSATINGSFTTQKNGVTICSINSNGIAMNSGMISLNASSRFELNTQDIYINSSNFKVDENGSVTMTNASVSGTLTSNNARVLTVKDIYVGTNTPTSIVSKMVHIIPTTGGSNTYSYTSPSRVALNNASFTLSAQSSVSSLAGKTTYKFVFPYLVNRSLSSGSTDRTLTVKVSDGTNTVTFVQTVSIKSPGGTRSIELTSESASPVLNSTRTYYSVTCTVTNGAAVNGSGNPYLMLESGSYEFSATASSGSSSGWTPATVMVYM